MIRKRGPLLALKVIYFRVKKIIENVLRTVRPYIADGAPLIYLRGVSLDIRVLRSKQLLESYLLPWNHRRL